MPGLGWYMRFCPSPRRPSRRSLQEELLVLERAARCHQTCTNVSLCRVDEDPSHYRQPESGPRGLPGPRWLVENKCPHGMHALYT